jgi:hypothetical protein
MVLVFILGVVIGALIVGIIWLIATGGGARSVTPAELPPRLTFDVLARFICPGDTVHLTWTGTDATTIQRNNESLDSVNGRDTTDDVPPSVDWSGNSTILSGSQDIVVNQSWYFRAAAVTGSGTRSLSHSILVQTYAGGERFLLTGDGFTPRQEPIVCNQCEGEIRLQRRFALSPEEWSPRLRVRKLSLPVTYDRPAMMVFHQGNRYEVQPGIEFNVPEPLPPVAGDWLLCAPARQGECAGQDPLHNVGGNPTVRGIDLIVEVECR